MADKGIENWVLPDLEDLDARVTKLEQQMHGKIDVLAAAASDLAKTSNAKIEPLDNSLSSRLDVLFATMAANHASLLHALEIHRRLQRLEALANKVR
jgi:hypothetical protein